MAAVPPFVSELNRASSPGQPLNAALLHATVCGFMKGPS